MIVATRLLADAARPVLVCDCRKDKLSGCIRSTAWPSGCGQIPRRAEETLVPEISAPPGR